MIVSYPLVSSKFVAIRLRSSVDFVMRFLLPAYIPIGNARKQTQSELQRDFYVVMIADTTWIGEERKRVPAPFRFGSISCFQSSCI